MKKAGLYILVLVLALAGVGYWLLAKSDPKTMNRETVSVPVELPANQ